MKHPVAQNGHIILKNPIVFEGQAGIYMHFW